MSQNYRVLAINPGSTSTKIGVFEGEKLVYEGVVRHTAEEIAAWGGVIAQAPMRMKLIKDLLAKENIDLATMDAFVGRGGIVRPLKSGVYTINEKLLDDLYHCPVQAVMLPLSAESLPMNLVKNTESLALSPIPLLLMKGMTLRV